MEQFLQQVDIRILWLIVACLITFALGHRVGVRHYKKKYHIAFGALSHAVADRIYAEKRLDETKSELEFLRKPSSGSSNQKDNGHESTSTSTSPV